MPKHPTRVLLESHVCDALACYWPGTAAAVAALPIPARAFPEPTGPLRLVSVALPDWAAEIGVDGALLVPSEACGDGWAEVDWWLAAFLLLECWHERVHEARFGPIHSYAFRLRGWDVRAWDHAWVNRIALFLRAWVERQGADCGALPASQVLLTHDVDAVAKTWSIRLKQSAFNAFNGVRDLLRGNARAAAARAVSAARFLASADDWWTLDALLDAEQRVGIHARFHFHADPRRRTPRRWLFDPAYRVDHPRVRAFIARVAAGAGEVGLHPSWDAWSSRETIELQRATLEAVVGKPVSACRQHWLRFGWSATWAAQEAAGLRDDTTLMFNDRPGFRNSAALAYRPWDARHGRRHELTAVGTVFMDSHCYDYRAMNEDDIDRWIGEVHGVHGHAAVLWHPHTLSSDYGWSGGFSRLLSVIVDGMR